MRDKIEERLAQLRQEYDEGQRLLADLDARKANLQATLLRISGAMQVLEELLAGERVTSLASVGERQGL